MIKTLDGRGREAGTGQIADALESIAAGDRKRELLAWLTMIFSAVAAVAALIAAF